VGGGIDIDMAEISRQMRQEPLHVLAFPVPANQSPDCKSMSEVVEPGLKAPSVEAPDSNLSSKPVSEFYAE